MSELIETVIPSDIDRDLLGAFLHGHIDGSYKFYIDDETDTLVIKFEDGESAANFKLKGLDEIFMKEFGNACIDRVAKEASAMDIFKQRQGQIMNEDTYGLDKYKKVMYPNNGGYEWSGGKETLLDYTYTGSTTVK